MRLVQIIWNCLRFCESVGKWRQIAINPQNGNKIQKPTHSMFPLNCKDAMQN